MPNSSQGSLWRKWDLHVHTPLSISQGYGGNTPKAWEEFFQNIENLPPEIKVIGINDYIFIDGYEKVLEAKKSGRLSNIDLILPVIELRIERFSGVDGNLRRLNYHVIFSNEVSPNVIRHQFIGALSAEYKLSPEYESLGRSGSKWSGVVTDIASLQELGQWLTENTPDDKKGSLPSPLDLGFANLNYPIEEIKKRLCHHNFAGKYLTAIGKREWSGMRWDGGGAASKKDLINSVDFVFTAAKTVEGAKESIESLSAQEVNSRLLDCSDAHNFSDSDQHMRLGHCFSWIKADTTFEGLKIASKNYPSRIFIGSEPTKSALVKSKKTKYIRSLKITKKEDSSLPECWFNAELLFNHDLVVVIGNKGNAKSALTDILGLCGNTRIKEFSFLNRDRFCDKNNKASHFEAEICWESGVCKVCCLSDKVDINETELVRYVPQSFFEKVTNEVAASVGGDFDKELKKVIFSHIPESDRLEFEDLDSLLKHHAGLVESSLKRLREKIFELNEEITELEDKTSDAEIKKLLAQIQSQRQVIKSHEDSKPTPVAKPEDQSQQAQKLEEDRKQIEFLKDKIEQKKDSLSQAKRRRSTVVQVIGELKQQFDAVESQRDALSQRLNETGITTSLADVLQISLDVSPLEKIKEEEESEIQNIEKDLNPEISNNLSSTLKLKQEKVNLIQEELSTADRSYQLYVASQQDWETTKRKLIGSPEDIGSLEFLVERKRLYEEDFPLKLEQLKEQRKEIVNDIYLQLEELKKIYRNLAHPVQKSMDMNRLTQKKYGLDFKVRLVLSNFLEHFLEFIHQGRAGSFNGKEEGKSRLEDLCGKYDFERTEDAFEFVDRLLNMLNSDFRYDPPRETDLKSQLRNRSIKDLYDYIFSLEYLNPEYSLQLDGKEMKQLSPGERGVLLLIFYLLIDKDDCPLLIDQPEENLDNQSIYNLLVPAVREAKKRRQIFLVTHNPNLAIVCDADQIIHSGIDKNDGNRVSYRSGAVENPIFNRYALDILEGTQPAFDVRKDTYLTLWS